MTINRVPEKVFLLVSDQEEFALGFIVVLVFVHIFCGIIASVITSAKGHKNNGAWFVIGLLLGIIGVISAAFQPNLHYTNYNQPLNYYNPPNTNVNNNVVFCRTCGSANNSGSKFCKDCGSKLE